MKKLVVFDFDGTIAKANIKRLVFKVAKVCNLKMPGDEDIERMRGMDIREIIKELKISRIRLIRAIIELRRTMANDPGKVEFIDGMRETLSRLSKEYELGIVSTNAKKVVLPFLKMHDLEIFKFVYADVGLFAKARALKKVRRRNKVRAEDIIYIGDEVRDIEAAKRAHAKPVAVTWGLNNAKILKSRKPNAIVSTPQDLIKAVERL